MEIQIVDTTVLDSVIETYQPKGLYLAYDGKWWIAVDNSTGSAWTEDFGNQSTAINWLRGEFEVSDC